MNLLVIVVLALEGLRGENGILSTKEELQKLSKKYKKTIKGEEEKSVK